MDILSTDPPSSTCASHWINSTIGSASDDHNNHNDTQVILHTIKMYGLLFGISLLLFCCLRQWFPRVYNIRHWVEKYRTPLAADARGWVSWMWKLVFSVTELELRDECGMDALCYSRIFSFGIKISAVGMFHALWLMPVYGTERVSPLIQADDPLARVSISNLPAGSLRFVATVVAAYCTFGYVMYLMLRELEWFTRTRHGFLTKRLPRNYTVYVESIPEELRNNLALQQFFQEGFAPHTVLSAQLTVTASNVKGLKKQRGKILNQLQVAIDEQQEMTSRIGYLRGEAGAYIAIEDETDLAMEALYCELEEMNRTVSNCIDEIEQRTSTYRIPLSNLQQERNADSENNESGTASSPPDIDVKRSKRVTTAESSPLLDETTTSHHSALDAVTGTLLDAASTVEEWSDQVVRGTGRVVMELVSNEDGLILPSAFVTFTSMRGTHSALQMVQYPEFYAMKVSEAPQPEDVIWSNVGRPHQELKLFSIISVILTGAICLLWTIPMAFISSVANLNGLRAQFPWLDEVLMKHPRLQVFFNQLAPLLILVAGQMMYFVTEAITTLEGPISGAIVQSRMFVKLYWFQIIQVRLSGKFAFDFSPTVIISWYSAFLRRSLFQPSVARYSPFFRI